MTAIVAFENATSPMYRANDKTFAALDVAAQDANTRSGFRRGSQAEREQCHAGNFQKCFHFLFSLKCPTGCEQTAASRQSFGKAHAARKPLQFCN